MNVCYCGNEKIYRGAFLSAFSLAKNTKETVHVFLLTADLRDVNPAYSPISEMHRKKIEEGIKRFNKSNDVALIDATKMFKKEFLEDNKNFSSMYTPFAYLRLLMDLIPEIPDRILYLDADTLVLKDVSNFYNINLEGKDLALVHDVNRESSYGNTGVILFDIGKIRKDNSFVKCRKYLKTHKLMMPDQDTINHVYKHNKTRMFVSRIYNEQRKMRKETAIRHYCQSIRLWPYFHIVKTKPWEWEEFKRKYPEDSKLSVFDEFNELD